MGKVEKIDFFYFEPNNLRILIVLHDQTCCDLPTYLYNIYFTIDAIDSSGKLRLAKFSTNHKHTRQWPIDFSITLTILTSTDATIREYWTTTNRSNSSKSKQSLILEQKARDSTDTTNKSGKNLWLWDNSVFKWIQKWRKCTQDRMIRNGWKKAVLQNDF